MEMSMPTRLSRRRLGRIWWTFAAPVALVAVLLAIPVAGQAQDESTPGTETSVPIISTGTGEVPSNGGQRPGPFDLPAAAAERPAGVRPVSIEIDKAAVNAEIEPLKIVDGEMQDPTGPWVVAWYENLSGLGERGNVVMAGHIDYWNVGPSVFYTINQLAQGDKISVTGANGDVYAYQVDWVREYDADNAPLDEITGRAAGDVLTLITCGGTFDYADGKYLQRTVVRASHVAA